MDEFFKEKVILYISDKSKEKIKNEEDIKEFLKGIQNLEDLGKGG